MTGEACLVPGDCASRALRLFGSKPPVPRRLSGEPSAGALREFAIFRRPKQPRDEPPPDGLVKGRLGPTLAQDYPLSRYYPDYVRRLVGAGAGGYFAVPAYARREAVPPAHCFGSARERQMEIEMQRRRLTEPVYCLIRDGADQHPNASACEALRISYRAAPSRVVGVTENVFVFKPPPPTARLEAEVKRLSVTPPAEPQPRRLEAGYRRDVEQAQPTRVEWLDRGGDPIRTIEPPAPGTVAPTTVAIGRPPIGG